MPLHNIHLSLSAEGVGETPHVVNQTALVTKELKVSAVVLEAALSALFNVDLATKGREAPVLGDDDLLAAGELVLGAAEGFNGCGAVSISCSDAQQDLADVDTGDEAVGLAKGTTHSGL